MESMTTAEVGTVELTPRIEFICSAKIASASLMSVSSLWKLGILCHDGQYSHLYALRPNGSDRFIFSSFSLLYAKRIPQR